MEGIRDADLCRSGYKTWLQREDGWGEARKEELRKEITAMGCQIGIEDFPIRRRAAFFMVKHVPRLLKLAHSAYRSIRMLLLGRVGK